VFVLVDKEIKVVSLSLMLWHVQLVDQHTACRLQTVESIYFSLNFPQFSRRVMRRIVVILQALGECYD
jgi:hypothetical protein